eukprot:TRINITY_DN5286_c0_g1_i1.p1 TRINITY_DN5286_c0_g1~~TRINITY_DN5286_c0_g1_i1.p1  ORF type:complete len:737 (+),score=119.95 TRINITY_DN5286_c0_g1_i1:169-2379(+)
MESRAPMPGAPMPGAPMPGAPMPGAPMQGNIPEAVPNAVMYRKTKMCSFFQNGVCTRGRECRFAHSEMDLNPLSFYRTRLCRSTIAGTTCTTPNCSYAHSKEELRGRDYKDDEDNLGDLGDFGEMESNGCAGGAGGGGGGGGVTNNLLLQALDAQRKLSALQAQLGEQVQAELHAQRLRGGNAAGSAKASTEAIVKSFKQFSLAEQRACVTTLFTLMPIEAQQELLMKQLRDLQARELMHQREGPPRNGRYADGGGGEPLGRPWGMSPQQGHGYGSGNAHPDFYENASPTGSGYDGYDSGGPPRSSWSGGGTPGGGYPREQMPHTNNNGGLRGCQGEPLPHQQPMHWDQHARGGGGPGSSGPSDLGPQQRFWAQGSPPSPMDQHHQQNPSPQSHSPHGWQHQQMPPQQSHQQHFGGDQRYMQRQSPPPYAQHPSQQPPQQHPQQPPQQPPPRQRVPQMQPMHHDQNVAQRNQSMQQDRGVHSPYGPDWDQRQFQGAPPDGDLFSGSPAHQQMRDNPGPARWDNRGSPAMPQPPGMTRMGENENGFSPSAAESRPPDAAPGLGGVTDGPEDLEPEDEDETPGPLRGLRGTPSYLQEPGSPNGGLVDEANPSLLVKNTFLSIEQKRPQSAQRAKTLSSLPELTTEDLLSLRQHGARSSLNDDVDRLSEVCASLPPTLDELPRLDQTSFGGFNHLVQNTMDSLDALPTTWPMMTREREPSGELRSSVPQHPESPGPNME